MLFDGGLQKGLEGFSCVRDSCDSESPEQVVQAVQQRTPHPLNVAGCGKMDSALQGVRLQVRRVFRGPERQAPKPKKAATTLLCGSAQHREHLRKM